MRLVTHPGAGVSPQGMSALPIYGHYIIYFTKKISTYQEIDENMTTYQFPRVYAIGSEGISFRIAVLPMLTLTSSQSYDLLQLVARLIMVIYNCSCDQS